MTLEKQMLISLSPPQFRKWQQETWCSVSIFIKIFFFLRFQFQDLLKEDQKGVIAPVIFQKVTIAIISWLIKLSMKVLQEFPQTTIAEKAKEFKVH